MKQQKYIVIIINNFLIAKILFLLLGACSHRL